MAVTKTKKPTNVSADAALVAEAKALGINLSRVFEEGLRERVAAAKRAKWLKDNADAIEQYNELIENEGSFGDQARTF